MDERLTMRCWRTAILGMVLAFALAGTAVGQNTDYSIMSWAYGVVVWPDRPPSDLTVAKRFAERLKAAADEAFACWDYASPEVPGDWEFAVEHAGRLEVVTPCDVRIVDDATGSETIVPLLEWEGRPLCPVVVIAFVSGWRMLDALGETATVAARFHFGPAVGSYPDAEAWVGEVGGAYRTMVCASYAGDDVLIHEFAHWFVYEWCSANGVLPWNLPAFIHEGMAETTAASAEDSTHEVWERQAVIDWAEHNRLSVIVGAASTYTVGESFVTYLVSRLGAEGFLETLATWASEPEVLIELYEPGWRESLGLPRECGVSEEGPE